MANKQPHRICIRFPEEEVVLIKKIMEKEGTSFSTYVKQNVMNNIHRNFDTRKWEQNFAIEQEKQLRAMSEERKKK